jgi:hypothetical protein
VAVIKSLASAICIGTGGLIGREGPIAQIGSALGSTLGQLLHLSDERIRNLMACGAAGGVSIRDLEQALSEGAANGRTVADIATTDGLLTCFPEEPMWKALCTMGPRDISQLPVLKQRGSRRLIGLLQRRDIIQAYNNAIAKKAHDQHRAEFLRVSKLNDADFAKVTITPDSASAGRLISELKLPEECLIVSVQRGNQLIIPHGYTRLRAKDQLTIFAENRCLPDVGHHLDDPSTSESEIADDQNE